MISRLLAPLVLVAAPLAAQGGHPDFTGTWVLDATKTVVDGSLTAPVSATYIVSQHGDSIAADERSSSDQGDIVLKKVWKVDGRNWANGMTYQGASLTLNSVLSWNDAVLAIRTNTDFNGTPVEQFISWTLGAGGNTLTESTTTNVNGTYYAAVTLVFNKKP